MHYNVYSKVFLFKLIILSCVVSILSANSRYRPTPSDDNVPKPIVQALYPRGIRVSLPHINGLSIFTFHGKVKSQFNNRDSEILAMDVTHPTNGQWIFEDHNIQLKIGDVISYWIFLQINGMGYRYDNLSSTIQELVATDSQQEDRIITPTTRPRQTSTQKIRPRQTPTQMIWQREISTTTRPYSCDCTQYCQNTIERTTTVPICPEHNPSKSIMVAKNLLEIQVDSLKEVIEDLTRDMNIGTQLLLAGQKPPSRDALSGIEQLITDKLDLVDLKDKVKHAHETENGILFEMDSSISKKRILHRANKVLIYSNYKIVDPQEKISDFNIDARVKQGQTTTLSRVEDSYNRQSTTSRNDNQYSRQTTNNQNRQSTTNQNEYNRDFSTNSAVNPYNRQSGSSRSESQNTRQSNSSQYENQDRKSSTSHNGNLYNTQSVSSRNENQNTRQLNRNENQQSRNQYYSQLSTNQDENPYNIITVSSRNENQTNRQSTASPDENQYNRQAIISQQNENKYKQSTANVHQYQYNKQLTTNQAQVQYNRQFTTSGISIGNNSIQPRKKNASNISV